MELASSTSSPAPLWLIPVLLIGIPLYVISLMTFICFILSRMGGWGRIAAAFPRRHAPIGRKYSMCSAVVGFVKYNNCMTITSSAEGLDIEPWKILIAHKPFFIPWTEIHNPEPNTMFTIKRIRFDVGSPAIGKLNLPERVFAEMPGAPPQG